MDKHSVPYHAGSSCDKFLVYYEPNSDKFKVDGHTVVFETVANFVDINFDPPFVVVWSLFVDFSHAVFMLSSFFFSIVIVGSVSSLYVVYIFIILCKGCFFYCFLL